MRFRLGLMIGFALGYVLGTRAGRARYEQIVQAWQSFRQSPSGQRLGARVKVAASEAGDLVEDAATEGMAKVTDLMRDADQGIRRA
jgi:hypothetical protein